MKLLIAFSLLVALVGSVLWFGTDALGRELSAVELALASVLLAAVAGRWLLVLRRRQRQKVEEMRDSALW